MEQLKMLTGQRQSGVPDVTTYMLYIELNLNCWSKKKKKKKKKNSVCNLTFFAIM